MSVDLSNEKGGYFKASNLYWFKILQLARGYGWVGKGTVDPLNGDGNETSWDGNYASNDGQMVESEDALALACALELALLDFKNPLDEVKERVQVLVKSDAEAIDRLIKDFTLVLPSGERVKLGSNPHDEFEKRWSINPFDYLQGDGENIIREFITFCKMGSFRIF